MLLQQLIINSIEIRAAFENDIAAYLALARVPPVTQQTRPLQILMTVAVKLAVKQPLSLYVLPIALPIT
jgi:hypothetical protein